MAVTELRGQGAQENLKAKLPALSDLKINGATPFWSHRDGASARLAEAYALLTMLRGAHDVCEEVSEQMKVEKIGDQWVSGPDYADAFKNIRHEIQGRALEGVATLIALAQYQADCFEVECGEREAGQ